MIIHENLTSVSRLALPWPFLSGFGTVKPCLSSFCQALAFFVYCFYLK
ncbi:hypothetical protein VL20_4601 [Microcystis panniformis FACHB-1757]|uniref:Uncharacterized protein n=1 Tax=Microcystis panniformis FACHB-1757 TaxID=1638788 RepID=A0A0K1S5T2_9CHRO|nr:hypothetical protein VL20_4601 [Microcystis panniformis FACHB-1757]